MDGRRIGYKRISPPNRDSARQLEGIPLDRVFQDVGQDTERPQLKEMLLFIQEGDTLLVHSMDRLGRSLEDLRRMVGFLTSHGIRVEFVKEGLAFPSGESPMSELLLGLMGSLAEFERELIRERQREGISQARERGAYKGRKPSLTPEQVRFALEQVARKVPKAHVARELKVSRETLYQYLRKA